MTDRVFPHPNLGHGWICPICRTAADQPVVLIPKSEPDEHGICEAEQVHAECWALFRKRRTDMALGRCPVCNDFMFTSHAHRCLPLHHVWCPEDAETEDDARSIHAHDPRSAAEAWAERDDCHSADYRIIGGQEVVVHVRDPNGRVGRFRVSGESVPEYTARELFETDD